MKLTRLFPLVGIFIFAYILMNIDVAKTLDIILRADPLFVLLGASMIVIAVIVKSIKWKFLIALYDKEYPLSKIIKSWLMGFSISMVTPARVGDISRAYYIKDKMGVGKGMITVVADRIIDVAILFSLAILGFIFFIGFFTQYSSIFYWVIGLFLLFIAGVYLSTKKRVIRTVLRPIFSRFVPEKHKSKINLTFNDFYDGLGTMRKNKRNVVIASLLGIVVWFFSIIQYYLLAIAIGIQVPIAYFLSIVPIVVLLDMLPISFSGIGTRDAALILFLSLVSVGKEYAISLSLLVLFFGYLTAGLAGAAFILREHAR